MWLNLHHEAQKITNLKNSVMISWLTINYVTPHSHVSSSRFLLTSLSWCWLVMACSTKFYCREKNCKESNLKVSTDKVECGGPKRARNHLSANKLGCRLWSAIQSHINWAGLSDKLRAQKVEWWEKYWSISIKLVASKYIVLSTTSRRTHKHYHLFCFNVIP